MMKKPHYWNYKKTPSWSKTPYFMEIKVEQAVSKTNAKEKYHRWQEEKFVAYSMSMKTNTKKNNLTLANKAKSFKTV